MKDLFNEINCKKYWKTNSVSWKKTLKIILTNCSQMFRGTPCRLNLLLLKGQRCVKYLNLRNNENLRKLWYLIKKRVQFWQFPFLSLLQISKGNFSTETAIGNYLFSDTNNKNIFCWDEGLKCLVVNRACPYDSPLKFPENYCKIFHDKTI